MQQVSASDFVSKVQPALAGQDWSGLLTILKENWSIDQMLHFLECEDADARKVAALAIGLLGQSCALPELSRKLHDRDPMVIKMAEHAMWQIFFRGGCEEANHCCARGAEALNKQDIDCAIVHLNRAIELAPRFAEAYNQRAIAFYLSDRFEDSIGDCLKVIELMPLHFGAWSGLGHSYLALGKMGEALNAYSEAVRINPHLECVAELVQELREKID